MFPLAAGTPEGRLPEGSSWLACPLAGWRSKQWPIERYQQLAARLDLPLVVNGPPSAAGALNENSRRERCIFPGSAGLIDAHAAGARGDRRR